MFFAKKKILNICKIRLHKKRKCLWELGKFWRLWIIPTILLFCFCEFIKLKSRLLYFGLGDKMKKCTRPECRKEQFSNMKSSLFLLFFYNNYLQMSPVYMVFSAGWQWGAEHTSQSGVLPSCCPLYPNLQIPCGACFWNSPWKECGFHEQKKVGLHWRSVAGNGDGEDDHFFNQYVNPGSG